MKTKSCKKTFFWLKFGIAVCSIFLLLSVIACGFIGYLTFSVKEYYSYSQKTFIFPELNDGFIPQGIDYDSRSDCFFLDGYNSNGQPSPIYLVNKSSNSLTKKVLLAYSDGSDFYGHSGGIKVKNDYIYVAGGKDCCLYVYSYDEVISANDGDKISAIGKFDTAFPNGEKIRVSFIGEYQNTLIAGEFYREGNYSTPQTHKITTKNGDYNQALSIAYEFSDQASATFGLDTTPVRAYSLPDKIQGMCFDNGKVFLSSSYGLAFSEISIYDAASLVYENDDFGVPLYSFDNASLRKKIKVPPMSEELIAVDGKLYIACESASNKYFFGKFTSSKWCYASDISKML